MKAMRPTLLARLSGLRPPDIIGVRPFEEEVGRGLAAGFEPVFKSSMLSLAEVGAVGRSTGFAAVLLSPFVDSSVTDVKAIELGSEGRS